MILVLEHALPPTSLAAELGRRLPEAAPTLAGWLASAPAELQSFPPAEHACTPLEGWLLRQAGYTPPDDVPLGAGWPVLAAGSDATSDAGQALWLAEFVHFHVSQQGVTLTDPGDLALTPADAQSLLDEVRPDLSEAGIQAQLAADGRLRLTLPDGLTPYAPTLAAAIGNEIQDWWPQHAAARPWRRVLNAVQMAWYDHPVNQTRARQGLASVNGLWLYGGGRPCDFTQPPSQAAAPTVLHAFGMPARRGDWAAWLDAARTLETTCFTDVARTLRQSKPEPLTLVLTGENRVASLSIRPARRLARWLPQRRHDWHAWWQAAPRA